MEELLNENRIFKERSKHRYSTLHIALDMLLLV